jgi:uncharacterized protein (DUF58 family)
MTNGISATLSELIALRRVTQSRRLSTASHSSRIGMHRSRARGRGMDFTDVRNYQAGDEIRHMEWRVTARTGRPHIKLYEEERERPVVILTDFNPSMYFGTRVAFKSLIAAKLASLIAWTANATGDRVGGLVFSSNAHHEFMPKSRDAGVLPLLASLAKYTALHEQQHHKDKPQALYDSLLRLKRVTKPGSLLVLISDFYTMNDAAEHHLNRLRNHNDILAYHICDPLELSAPMPGLYPMTDGIKTLCLDTTNRHLAQTYNQACHERVQSLKNQFKRLSIQYIQVSTQQDLPILVHQTFPRRAHG